MDGLSWVLRHCKFAQAVSGPVAEQDLERRIAAPGEAVNLLGVEDVAVAGDFNPVINVEGHGPIDIGITIQQVINSIKSYLNDTQRLMTDPSLYQYKKAFDYITNVVVGDFGPGEFGHAISTQPHTVYINWEQMRRQIENALNQQVRQFAQQYGVPPEITDDVKKRIQIKVAEQLFRWASGTIAHESRHARDFQDVLMQMILTGKGDLSQASEGRAESEEGMVSGLTPTV